MFVDQKIIELLSETTDTVNNKPLVCCFLDSLSRIISNQRILFANESNLTVFEIKKKAINVAFSRSWFEIRRVFSPNQKDLSLFFKDISIEIHHEDAQVILSTILQYIWNILTDKEMPEVDLDEFDYTILHKTDTAMYNRFRAITFAENVHVPDEIMVNVKEIVDSHAKTIDVSSVDPQGDLIPYILRSIQVNPRIKTVVAKTTLNGCMWCELGDFVAENTSVNSIVSYDPITNDFDYFIESFKKNGLSKVRKLSLIGAKVTKKQISQITELVEYHQLDSLCISNSLSGQSSIDMSLAFEGETKMQQIKTLILDGTKGLDISHLLRVTKNLKSLSICNCGIELCLLFGFMAYYKDINIEKLSCDGNKAHTPIKKELELPCSLKELSVRDVEFKIDNLMNLLQLANHHPISIDVSHAKLHHNAYKRFLENIVDIEDPKFVGIGWKCNKIRMGVLDFFDRCKNLKKLSINGCLDPKLSMFPHVIQFIAHNETIENIDISTREEEFAISETTMPIVISSLRENKHLHEVDLSGNSINGTCLSILADALMNNRVISKISFTLDNVGDGEIFKNFFERLTMRGAPLQFDYPINDIRRILSAKIIRESDIKQIKKNYEQIIAGDQSIEIPPETVSTEGNTPIGRRVLNTVKKGMPTDAEVELFISQEKDDFNWDVIQPQIPIPKDDVFLNKMKEKYNIDELLKSIIDV